MIRIGISASRWLLFLDTPSRSANRGALRLTLWPFVLLIVCVQNVSSEEDIQPRELLKRTIERYASLDSYSDSGVIVRHSYLDDVLVSTFKRHFSTNFENPNWLRFDWFENDPLLGVSDGTAWYTPNGAYTYGRNRGVKRRGNINKALSALGGVTSGASYLVPRFLVLNPSACRILANVREMRLVPPAELGITNVYAVELTYNHGTIVTWWVDADSLLIVKSDSWSVQDDRRVQTTIDFERVEINQQVDRDVFTVKSTHQE